MFIWLMTAMFWFHKAPEVRVLSHKFETLKKYNCCYMYYQSLFAGRHLWYSLCKIPFLLLTVLFIRLLKPWKHGSWDLFPVQQINSWRQSQEKPSVFACYHSNTKQKPAAKICYCVFLNRFILSILTAMLIFEESYMICHTVHLHRDKWEQH